MTAQTDLKDTSGVTFKWSVDIEKPKRPFALWPAREQATLTGEAGKYQVTLRAEHGTGRSKEASLSLRIEPADCPLPPLEEPRDTELAPPTMRLSVADLSSGTPDVLAVSLSELSLRSDQQAIGVIEAAEQKVEHLLSRALQLRRKRDNAVIEGRVEKGWVNLRGERVGNRTGIAFSFVPKEPLAHEWYTLRVDLSEAIQAGLRPPLLGNERLRTLMVALFFYGSNSMYSKLRVHCLKLSAQGHSSQSAGSNAGRSCVLSLALTEPITHVRHRALAMGARVTYDGKPVSCAPISSPHRPTESEVSFLCPEPPFGTPIEVMVAGLPSLAGADPSRIGMKFDRANLQNRETDANPVWFGEAPSRE